MLKTHKFARKPFYVDAVRVSEANMEEVAEWCDGEIIEHETDGKFISVKVHRPLTDRQTQAFVGDWVLFAGTGFKVYIPKAFDKSFEKVKTLTKAQADEAGIKVPHEPRQKPKRPVPTAPSQRQLTTNVGKAVREAQAAKEAKEAPPKVMGDVKKPFDVPDSALEQNPPRSLADIEADKLIAEVERLKAE